MSLVQLGTGRIVETDDLTVIDIPEPVNRPVAEYRQGVDLPELASVETLHGTRLMWIQRVWFTRRYADWVTLKVEGTFVDVTADFSEPLTDDAMTFKYEHHRGGTWGSSWYELAPPAQMTLFGPEEPHRPNRSILPWLTAAVL